jgi:transposase-like protein
MERLDKQHRYPWAVIEYMTYRSVAERLLQHGVDVSHKTVFEWVQKFGEVVTKKAKKRPAKSPYSVEEAYVKVNGDWKYMYGAVDKGGNILNAVFKDRRNLASAKAFLKKAVEAN